MAEKTLTTRAVARMLGVSEATIKRWAGDGVLRAEKTVGGHRRFRPEEVARFRQSQGLGQSTARPNLLRGETKVSELSDFSADSVFRALVGGHEAEVSALLINAHLQGVSIESIFDDLICEAMRRIGDLWSTGELTIAQEHYATRKTINALGMLRQVMVRANPTGLDALCCCAEEDFHELPSHLAQLLFEAEGWSAINLGSSTPFFVLTEALARYRPEIVCVSSTVLLNVDRATHEYGEFRRAAEKMSAQVVLGGRGFTDDLKVRQRFPAALHAENFRELSEFIKGFRGAPLAG